MLLRVKNLGPVREAELDLGKPLIVLTGPNNSGKTYLAWAAYSLAYLDGEDVAPPPSIHVWVDKIFDAEAQQQTLASLLDSRNEVLCAVAEAVKKQLPDDFATARDRFASTHIELLLDEANDLPRSDNGPIAVYGARDLVVSLDVVDQEARLTISIRSEEKTAKEIPIKDLSASQLKTAKRSAVQLVTRVLMDASLEPEVVTALPVERSAINLFARELAAKRTELVDELLIDASDARPPSNLRNKLQRRAGRYPLVVRDALRTAIQLSERADTGPMADLADELETKVLEGSVRVDAYDNLNFIPHQLPTLALGLHESASVVKSLVSLVLYLRYEAEPGQRLVIDEPELNLHPDNQRLIARILAKAVNRGLKIMMSTHSDYVIREINNLIMLGEGSDEAQALIQELGYQPEQTLRRDQIGAYLVNDGACTNLEVTETGFETKTIEDEIHKLNQDAQTIYFRLFGD